VREETERLARGQIRFVAERSTASKLAFQKQQAAAVNKAQRQAGPIAAPFFDLSCARDGSFIEPVSLPVHH
jgi:hypothetical protein